MTVYADPTETMNLSRERKSHNGGVVNNDDENGQPPEKIETRMARSIGETGIDCYFGRCLVNNKK